MKVVLFNWRDLAHPKAGGAEVYTHAFLEALSEHGHECTLFASRAPGLAPVESAGSYRILRAGTELTCRLHGLRWLRQNSRSVDLVIDEVNTLPFFSRIVVPRRTALLMHQLAREVWWKEAPPVVALLGYVVEPLMLQIYRGSPVITISKSSMESFRKFGLATDCRIVECPLEPPRGPLSLGGSGAVGYVGRVTPSKRIDHIIRAFSLVARTNERARLEIVGRGPSKYLRKLERLAKMLNIEKRVVFHGHVSVTERDELMSTFDCLVMASLREGWGLVVSEAAAKGVPTVSYDVPGLRDSIRHLSTGLLVRDGDWQALGDSISGLLNDHDQRDLLGCNAADFLQQFSPERFSESAARAALEIHRAFQQFPYMHAARNR